MSAPDLPTFPASQQKSVAAILRAAGCVFAEDEARLLLHTARSRDELDAMVDRRVAGEPLEPVLGWAEFCGLRIHIDSGVFVPTAGAPSSSPGRPAHLSPQEASSSTCVAAQELVGVVLQSTLDAVDLYAVDVEPAAVRCARRNITPPERVLEGDLFEPLPTELLGRVDVVVANCTLRPHRFDQADAARSPSSRTAGLVGRRHRRTGPAATHHRGRCAVATTGWLPSRRDEYGAGRNDC